MTWKQIETCRETRLWITQVIMPVAGVFAALMAAVPEFREDVLAKARSVKSKLKLHK